MNFDSIQCCNSAVISNPGLYSSVCLCFTVERSVLCFLQEPSCFRKEVLACFFVFCSSTIPDQRTPVASTHSISSATTPDRIRFPRGTASRSTFHGQLRERRTATYNGPPASPSLSHEATPLSQTRTRGSTNLFSKLTSKLTRRYVF